MNRELDPSDDPMAKLLKLTPAESTSAFLLLRGLMNPYDPLKEMNEVREYIFVVLTIIIIVLTPFLMRVIWGTKSIFFTCFITFSFIIWAANIEIQRFVALGQRLEGIWIYLLNPLSINGLLIIWAIMVVPLVLGKKQGAA